MGFGYLRNYWETTYMSKFMQWETTMHLTEICCLSTYGLVYFVHHSKLNGKMSLKCNGIISSIKISKYQRSFSYSIQQTILPIYTVQCHSTLLLKSHKHCCRTPHVWEKLDEVLFLHDHKCSQMHFVMHAWLELRQMLWLLKISGTAHKNSNYIWINIFSVFFQE